MIAGVDGCSEGWLVAVSDRRSEPTLHVAADLESLARDTGIETLVVDIPIGLLDRGVRAADRDARRLLKRRACCVFNAPIRPILECESYRAANAKWKAVEGKGCSAQGWAIVPKIKEVDRLVQLHPRAPVVEGHPEVSFALMNGGVPVPVSKHAAEGRRMRLELLSSALSLDAGALVGSQPNRYIGDAIDALALLWTAERIKRGDAQRFPAESERDSFGIEAVITA